MNKISSIIAIFFLSCSILMAGTKIITKSESLGCDKNITNGTSTLYLRHDIFRIDVKDEKSNIGIIYKKAEKKMWVLDYDEKKYYTISEEEFKKVSDQMNAMMERLDEQLKNVPEAQREQMMEMMKKSGAYGIQEEVNREFIKKEGSNKAIGSWQTVEYNYLVNGELKEIQWVADKTALNVPEEDMQVLKDFSSFLSDNFEKFSFGGSNSVMNPKRPYDGYPVYTVYYEGDKECVKSTVQSVENQIFENTIFQIPDGFRKEENFLKNQ